jgi:riboflavin kinase/FMN adenylyltransferase
MEIISLSQLPLLIQGSVVTIGTFDGVHLAHQKIFNKIVSLATEQQLKSVVITFWPHPKAVIDQNDSIVLLNTIDERLDLIAQCGIDYTLLIPFDSSFASKTAFDFLKNILIDGLHARTIVIGFDHHFGANREGNIQFLEQYKTQFGYQIELISQIELHNVAINSTAIRANLSSGNVVEANKLLGRKYSIEGKVIEGRKIGRTIGFPTANIKLNNPLKIVPKNGVYAVEVLVENQLYKGMMNIGTRPTFGEQTLSLEVHIFEFERDIYDKTIKVFFLNRIRDEQKFDSVERLIEQLKKDKKAIVI